MPLPVGVQTVRVFGTYLKSDGTPERGFLKFKPIIVTVGSGVVINKDEVRANLNNLGQFSISLPTSDNSGLNPDGWTYEAKVFFEGGTLLKYNFQLPVSPSEVDFSTIVPQPPIDPTLTYVTSDQLDAVAARLSYDHNQATPASIWVVTHDLGYRPNVQVFDSAGDEVKGAVEHDDVNGLTIAFSAAFSGHAYLS